MSALAGRCTYPFYHLRGSHYICGTRRGILLSITQAVTYPGKILSTSGVAKYELLAAGDSVIHASGRIPRRRTN